MLSVALVTGMLMTVSVVNASAGSGKPRVYEGGFDGVHGKIAFQLVKHTGRPLHIREIDFGPVVVTCDVDGTSQVWGVGFGWGGQLPAMPSHAIDMDEVDGETAIHLHGKIQAVHGTGTLSFAAAMFTADEQPQSCGTGDLTWSVDRTVPPVLQTVAGGTIWVRHYVMPDGTRITLTRYA